MGTKQQSGFAAMEAILILVIVAIIGGTGWFVWHSKQATEQSLTNTASSQPGIAKKDKTKPAAQPTVTPPKPDATKYLEITEWGVEIPLTSETQDAYYLGPKTTPGYDGTSYVELGTRSLTALDARCGPDATGAANISRETAALHDRNAANPDSGIGADMDTTQIGDYYYGVALAQAACSDNQAANEQQLALRKAFSDAFKEIKAVN